MKLSTTEVTGDTEESTGSEPVQARPPAPLWCNRSMSDCLFCQIVNREIQGSIVYEDQRVMAFNDVNPQAPTHVLVVPKRHIASLNEIGVEDDQIIGELVRRAAAIAKDRGLSAGGYRTVFNTNRDAGQTVFHIHLHLLGGRSMKWPPG